MGIPAGWVGPGSNFWHGSASSGTGTGWVAEMLDLHTSTSDALVSETIASIPVPSIDICPPTTMETYRAMNRSNWARLQECVASIQST